ncbi:hypothetical protein [Rhizobium leguminosarum]|uniref:hypothetical protein n=1 Tax=Rhizobium leguminosarum TaxID=384 RepID=UPI0014417E16|nr:hypothetical protein [Rhizobium leguminosarum]NKK78025.1 hypothetical protein [Rhizobium leguminosarum bv. viciae]
MPPTRSAPSSKMASVFAKATAIIEELDALGDEGLIASPLRSASASERTNLRASVRSPEANAKRRAMLRDVIFALDAAQAWNRPVFLSETILTGTSSEGNFCTKSLASSYPA